MEPRALARIDANSSGRGTVILAHGAGGHKDHPHILELETLLVKAGFSVFRFNFQYSAEGRKLPDRMPVLLQSFENAIAEALRQNQEKQSLNRIILAGHSLGGRVASLLAAKGIPCQGLMLFSYPLHPPGKLDLLRRDHFEKISIPILSLSGTRDAFCTLNLMEETVKPLSHFWDHHWLEGADHGWQILKRSGQSRIDLLQEAGQALEQFGLKLEAELEGRK